MITVKKTLFLIVPIIIIISLIFTCSKPPPPPIPQEGETVTWWVNSKLIIKTKLGARREHIPKKGDHRSYDPAFEPAFEKYLGQFPIDFIPEKFPTLTQQEFSALKYAATEGPWPGNHWLHFPEFYLMLNGQTAKATDLSVYSDVLDNSAQVKVVVNESSYHKEYTTRSFFEQQKMPKLNPASKVSQYGIDCYLANSPSVATSQLKVCLGLSLVKGISGFKLVYSPEIETIFVSSNEPIYGGTTIIWKTHKDNLSRAQEIDAAIWRLLAAWNVSPN